MKKYILFILFCGIPTTIISSQKKKHERTKTQEFKEQAVLPLAIQTQEEKQVHFDEQRPVNSPRASHADPTIAPTPENNTPRLSADEIETLNAAVKLEKQDKKELLRQAREAGFDTLAPEDEEAVTTKGPIPGKSWLASFSELPKQWWQEHITDQNRLEHFMRYAGIVRTYTILLQKMQHDALNPFIDDLNKSNAGEGNRWLDEALNQALEDRHERTTMKIMHAAIPYKAALTPLTRKNVLIFLNSWADKQRRYFEEDCNDFSTGMNEIADIMRHAEQDMPEIPQIAPEIFEQSARESVLALTKCATAGYLPRAIKQ
jgi:hypothetical protein